jgi:hypothetical protein
MNSRKTPMRRLLITAGLLLGGIVMVACGSAGPGVQARQTGETTTTTTTPETTTTSAPATTATTAPATTAPPVTVAAGPACTSEALTAAYNAKYGDLGGASLKVQQCAEGWATSAQTKGFDPPTFALYRADGDHWVALNRSSGKLCDGYGVPETVRSKIGCEA